jgi:hypothetical protein
MKRLIQLATILLLTAPLYAIGPMPPEPENQGDLGSGAGGTCASSSCSTTCSDGSMSGIACLARENAHCACNGRSKGYISQAAPYCTACS